MRHAGWLWAVVLALGIGCAPGPAVRSMQAPSYDFSRLKTYAWVEPNTEDVAAERFRNAALEKMIRAGVDRALIEKGYRFADDGRPDFLVAEYVSLQEKLDSRTFQRVYGYDRGMGPTEGRSPYDSKTRVETYEAGTLVVDVLDAATREVVWRGTAEGKVDPQLDSEKRRQRLREVARRMLAAFPPAVR